MGWVSSKDYSATWATMHGVTITSRGTDAAQFVVEAPTTKEAAEPVAKKVETSEAPAVKRVAKNTTPKKKTEPKPESKPEFVEKSVAEETVVEEPVVKETTEEVE